MTSTMPYVLLSGFMATGKSTLGPKVAARLGLPFVDTDDVITRDAGESVPALWSRFGEATFRDLEAKVLTKILASGEPSVVAVGGGTLTTRALRHSALEKAFVVTLEASAESIVARAGDLSKRPNLAAADPVARARHLLELRAAAYGESHLRVATDRCTEAEALERIVAAIKRQGVVVPLGERSYSVDLVRDQPSALTEALAALDPTAVVVVTDSHVEAARGAALRQALAPLHARVVSAVLAPGEEEKNLNTVSLIWDAALGQGIDRRAVVLGFGGGVVGDMAGFAASTLLRGLRLVQAPTTLLAMVDASVGGKTGFDHPAGKNLIGTFCQPNRVVADLAHLRTLPLRELRAGLAEVVKMAVLEGGAFLEALEAKAERLGSPEVNRTEDGLDALAPFVRASILGKMRLVRDDELESGPRALLNLGHTAAHALESHSQYRKHLHGEAVGIGMVIELAAGERAGFTKAGTSLRVATLLKRLGLPSSVAPEELRAAWHFVGSDKKKSGSSLLWPLVGAVGEPRMERVALVDLEHWALGH